MGRALRLAVALGTLVLASSARAEGDDVAPPSQLTDAARAHYDAGSVYYDKGELERAIEEFRAGQRDDDRPAFDFNLGVCYRRLGDPVRAVAALRRFLQREPSTPQRAEVQAWVAELEARIGTLVITSRVPDARFTVDDEPAQAGRLRVAAGVHRVAAAKAGYLPRTVEVTAVAGAETAVAVDPAEPRRSRRRAVAIGLGVTAGVLVVGAAVTLGVVLGTRATFDPHPTDLGAIVVRP